MTTATETKTAKQTTFNLEDKEATLKHLNGVTHERARVEALNLKGEVEARHALVESLKPEQQGRLAEHLKTLAMIPPIGVALAEPQRQIPLPSCISYQVLRPPFTTGWWAHPLRVGTGPFLLQSYCESIVTHQPLGLTAISAQGILSEGALSVQAAIGDFFNARCRPQDPWFIGEANTASAAMGLIADTGVQMPSSGFMSVEVDLAMEGQVGWSNFVFPGEPSTGLGLVGFLGIAGFLFQTTNMTANGKEDTLQDGSERFLLGSASAYFPGQVDRKPTFTMRHMALLSPGTSTVKYAMAISADLTAFQSTPINGGFPGFAHANLTVRETPGPLQPGTPLKIKEIRTAICLW
jgi:hypothetical protein